MIDLEQFERRLRQPNTAGRADEDPLAELARLVGGQDDDAYKADPYKAVFEQKGQQPSAGRAETHDDYADAYETERWREPAPDDLAEQERLISGNFASIEAGLRATGRPPAGLAPGRFEQLSDGGSVRRLALPRRRSLCLRLWL
ncbi:protein of unknown function [Methylocella tundrae]|uniref:Uncharacterized protein n=1 Tax=Methylocella tundrae TaxID=227605 RepID=A0A4U8YX93_METTU|nr:protein of unknown function [Methylocella tundrae]